MTITKGGFAPRTYSALIATAKDWAEFAKRQGQEYCLPANEDLLLFWFLEMDHKRNLSLSTIQTRKNLLSMLLDALGMANSLKSNKIKQHFRGLPRIIATKDIDRAKAKVAYPFRRKDLDWQIEAAGKIEGLTLRQLRDLTYLTLAYWTAVREGEIISLKRDDLVQTDSGIVMLRNISKTMIAPPKKIIPVQYSYIIEHYLTRMDECYVNHAKKEGVDFNAKDSDLLKDGFIFVDVLNNGVIKSFKPIRAMTVHRIFKRAFMKQSRAGHNIERVYTGHSGRVGRVLDAKLNDASDIELMDVGDWTNLNTVKRYLRATNYLI